MTRAGHGFVWPSGLPRCAMCDSHASDPIHVTPSATMSGYTTLAAVEHQAGLPRRSHPYVMPGGVVEHILCLACGGNIRDGRHPVGQPSGRLMASHGELPTGVRETAFVAEIGDRLVFAGRGTTGADLLPEGMAKIFRERASTESANMWITGRYVEADAPNRNAAYWSTGDLEVGQPTVAHGPINWLHEERHIIGSIAASELVKTRETASEGDVGNHIVALGAVWPWVYPNEARLIRDSSESGNLWFSMECISRTVACLEGGCENEMTYRDYMTQRHLRCDHMKSGCPRRFIDPVFEGAGIIVPPVRPGWAKADARVLMPQAAALVERQAAAFEGMTATDAETVVAQLIAAAE